MMAMSLPLYTLVVMCYIFSAKVVNKLPDIPLIQVEAWVREMVLALHAPHRNSF